MLPPEDHCLEGNERMKSAGRAVPGAELKVVGDDGEELPIGEVGELICKSPSNMAGYSSSCMHLYAAATAAGPESTTLD